MTTDPFEPLGRIDPPDQWDDIAARAADPDVELDEPAGGGRRPRGLALLAVAAALVLVVGGLALATSGDDDELTAANGPGSVGGAVIPGECPFSLAPGEGLPDLQPADPWFPATTSADALDPPTVGRGQVDGIQVDVQVSTFPVSEAQRQARWSGPDGAAAVGWFEDAQTAPLDARSAAARLALVFGGGHLGRHDETCRDVLVGVRVPDPAPETGRDPARPLQSASTTEATPGVAAAPTTSSTTTDPGQDQVQTPGLCVGPAPCDDASGGGSGTTIDPESTTTSTTAPDGQAGSCVSSAQPCDDTKGPLAELDAIDVTEEAIQRGRELIERILDAIRFPEPTPDDGGDDSATEDWTAVPGDCPFYLDPAAGFPELDPASELGLEPSTRVDYPAPTVGRMSQGGIDFEVAVTTMPPSDAQREQRWASFEVGRAVGWVDGYWQDNGVDEDGRAWLMAFSGGHLGPADASCRDVLVWARVDDIDAATLPSGPPSNPGDAHATVRRRVGDLISEVRFPGSDDNTPSVATTAPAATPPPDQEPVSPTPPYPEGPDDFGGTLLDGRRFTAHVTPEQVCVTVEADSGNSCSSRPGGPSAGVVTLDPGTDEEQLLLHGARPQGAVDTYVADADGERVDAPVAVAPDGSWYVASFPYPFAQLQLDPWPVLHLDAAGNPIPTE